MGDILIIDDEPEIRSLIRAVLESDGHTITEASDGSEGINSLHESPVDVIITDIIMPGKEGLETINELRKMKSDVKIVAMSGGRQNHLETAKLLGASKIIQKPFNNNSLILTIRELINRRE